ncbi:MAG: T9SS type A sorting domain-containing protein [Chitinophagales bacterium]|nr:T9SS type A sorting domain-containing protein [Chitinophagales bacterium]
MMKFNFLKTFLVTAMAMPLLAVAQPKMGAWGDQTTPSNNNFYIDYVGGRVTISTPSNLAGPVIHTISNDGKSSGQWGGSIAGLSNPIVGIDIVKADPYDACGTLVNASAISGKIALIKRGTCEFGAKALNAENAGAVAVIIVNHSPGPPVGMGAGAQGANVTIPVIMVSDVEGAAIETALSSGAVKMSLSVWSNGYNNDIGFVDAGLGLQHAYSIPLAQITGASSVPYKAFYGAVIGNFGTTTANNVKMYATLKWTPTGGSTSVVRVDSTSFTGFAPGDSIVTPFIDKDYDLAPTGTGRYDVEYELTSDVFTDQFMGDNKASYSFYVDNHVYSKGRYDFNNDVPFSGRGYRLSSNAEFTWGPFLYMEKAGYQFENAMISLSKENAQTDNSMASIGKVQILVWKWTDANGDSVIVADECSIVGLGEKTFVAADTSGQVHKVVIKDAFEPSKVITTEANTWYWISAAMPTNAFLAVDGESNYFVRSWGRKHATNSTREPYAPLFPNNFGSFTGSTTPDGVPAHYPFESYYFLEDSIRFSQQKNGLVPSIPVSMSLFKVGVENTQSAAFDVSLYPNPATEVLNVAVTLDKPANDVTYSVLNVIGAKIKEVTHNNVSNDKYTINTSELAAGSYYLIISVDGQQTLRKFSVIK